MKIMKYQGATETEAMLLAKNELGSDALILSITSVRPRGILGWFRKPFVEVVAALEEKTSEFPKEEGSQDKDLEEFKKFLSKFSERQKDTEENNPVVRKVTTPTASKQDSENYLVSQVIYEQLLENEVEISLANRLMSVLIGENNMTLETGLDKVYRQIVMELSEVKPIRIGQKAKTIFFVGSTGVGKTTTIAKLASVFALEKKCKIALITADTYRIAAVEQLKTYANILGIPIRVIYDEEEILECLEEFKDMDFVFVDTAGRSYQDSNHLKELDRLLQKVEEKEVYLVLSLSTKTSDLKKNVSAYHFTDYSLIFTKLDETQAYGGILNLRYETGKPLSYLTTGQNVPEDIAELDPYEIANKILGGVNS